MTHAIELLQERQCELRALIRKCCENSDRHMVGVGKADYGTQLMEVERAIEVLLDAGRKSTTERIAGCDAKGTPCRDRVDYICPHCEAVEKEPCRRPSGYPCLRGK